MDAYIYDADIYCVACGETLANDLAADCPRIEDETDSGTFPQRVADGGGEADCPQHCGGCGLFLANPLTDEGRRYVREAYSDLGSEGREFPEMWMDYYDLHRECKWCGQTLGPADDKFCPECIEDGGV